MIFFNQLLGANNNLSLLDCNLVFDGSSQTRSHHGTDPTIEQYLSLEIEAVLAPLVKSLTVNSFGVGGQTMQQMIDDYQTQIAPLYDPTKKNLLVLNEDANGIYGDGYTAEENLEKVNQYIAAAKLTGWTILFWISWPLRTPYPAGITAGEIIEHEAFFELFEAREVNAKFFFDARTVEEIGSDLEQPISNIFDDYIHLNQAGNDLLKVPMGNAIINAYKNM